MPEVSERRFPVTTEGLASGTEFLDEVCINPRIAIVFDEIASNIVRCSGATFFLVRVTRDADLILEIEDDGKEFDPTVLPDPDITASVEDRDIGGLGLFMVKKMSKSFTYKREDGKNKVKVVIK